MWHIDTIETRSVDFGLSELAGARKVTEVLADGVRLANAIELAGTFLTGPTAQLEICDCGQVGCTPGNFVALRRLGDSVVWVPAWTALENAEEGVDVTPPPYVRSRGAPMFGERAWERLRSLNASFPALAELPPLDTREAVRCVQWSAPGRALGEFPSRPRVRRDLVVAVTHGDLATELDRVDEILRSFFDDRRAVVARPSSDASRPVELWLDLPGVPALACVAEVDGGAALVSGDVVLTSS